MCFGKKAEAIASYVQKGHLFGLTGRLRIDKYVDKEGKNRWSTEVTVEDFEFLESKGSNNNNPPSQNPNKNNQSIDYGEDLTPIDDGSDIPF